MEDKSKVMRELYQEILKCTKCELYKNVLNKVPGEGDPNAKIMFIGEAPGREEDRQGRPFVGKAGQLLTELIKNKLGLDRSQVYITNVLKCRPPGNRDPLPEEIKACSPWLEKQLEIIKPDVIVTLGRFSAEWIFKHFGLKFTKISEVRGKVFKVRKWGKEITIIPTLHPAAALYHAKWRPLLEKDFDLIANILRGEKKKTLLDFMNQR